eukprot:GILK01000362.1.p1 GENE.GILK01000362.1~~GILK01000362.1.p1  ORF type:complete len:414 (+),score=47.23 GILK01000362.1:34-1242(+)
MSERVWLLVALVCVVLSVGVDGAFHRWKPIRRMPTEMKSDSKNTFSFKEQAHVLPSFEAIAMNYSSGVGSWKDASTNCSNRGIAMRLCNLDEYCAGGRGGVPFRLPLPPSNPNITLWMPIADGPDEFVWMDSSNKTNMCLTATEIMGAEKPNPFPEGPLFTLCCRGGLIQPPGSDPNYPNLDKANCRCTITERPGNQNISAIVNCSCVQTQQYGTYDKPGTYQEQVGCYSRAMGLENGEIPDTSFAGSSRYDNSDVYTFSNARLNRKGYPWCPEKADDKQYLEIDLGDSSFYVEKVGIQGRSDMDMWTTSFKVQVSADKQSWRTAKDRVDGDEFFKGSNDRDTIAYAAFKYPLRGQFVRIIPVEWKSLPCLRAEVYGCQAKPRMRSSRNGGDSQDSQGGSDF